MMLNRNIYMAIGINSNSDQVAFAHNVVQRIRLCMMFLIRKNRPFHQHGYPVCRVYGIAVNDR